MTASIREQILAEIKTRLDDTEGISGRVYRSRDEAIRRNEMPCLVVMPVNDPAQQVVSTCQVDRLLTVRIMVFVHADIPDQAADPIVVDLHSKIIPQVGGFPDFTLGGLAIDISQAGDNFEFAPFDGSIIVEYIVNYRHNVDDLTA